MKHAKHVTALAVASVGLITSGGASAATLTDWNTDNVVVGPTVDPGDPEQTGESDVYDRDVTGGTAGAVTNGRIVYHFPEANGCVATPWNTKMRSHCRAYPGNGSERPGKTEFPDLTVQYPSPSISRISRARPSRCA